MSKKVNYLYNFKRFCCCRYKWMNRLVIDSNSKYIKFIILTYQFKKLWFYNIKFHLFNKHYKKIENYISVFKPHNCCLTRTWQPCFTSLPCNSNRYDHGVIHFSRTTVSLLMIFKVNPGNLYNGQFRPQQDDSR